MSSVVISHQQIGKGRVASQYKNSPKLLAYLAALLEFSDELEGVFHKIAEQIDLDLAEGVNLDVIGEIVGAWRLLNNVIPLQFFGFSDQSSGTAGAFGEEGKLGIGARLWDELEPYGETSVLPDPEFRMLVRAKIIKNHASGTNEDILDGLGFIFPGAIVYVEDTEAMIVNVAIGRGMTLQEKHMLKMLGILPKAGGVRIGSYVTFDAISYFGFDGQLNALSFGEEGQPGGGLFAEEF